VALRIFISYRREDTAGHAGRLYDSLATRFGPENVFMDVDAIGLGSDFAQVIDGAVEQCHVLVALMGRHWLAATGDDGGRRLDSPDDFVRVELESALGHDVFIIPTAVQGVAFPSSQDLPPSLEPLARRQGIELRDPSWHDDVKRLTRRLEALASEQERGRETRVEAPPARPRRRRRLLLIAGGIAVLAAAAAGIAIALIGGGSSGGTSGNSAAEQQLLATIPAVTRPTCHSISYGDPAARAAVGCAGVRVSINYNLFPNAATLRGWYTQQRETARIAPGSGRCTPTSFRGEGTRPGGNYFCFVASDGEAYLTWTDATTNVGAVANVYEGKGPAAAASLLRQWRCCL
jgi:F0F1-type ATP synthase membrane subunit c/vacuolar-type H+-ATPase subunit K